MQQFSKTASEFRFGAVQKRKKARPFPAEPCLFLYGGAKRDRTADLRNAIAALSQLSYGPETF
jgi:hypothetical protein